MEGLQYVNRTVDRDSRYNRACTRICWDNICLLHGVEACFYFHLASNYTYTQEQFYPYGSVPAQLNNKGE